MEEIEEIEETDRTPVLEALRKIPEGVWIVYLLQLRCANTIVGGMLLDDPTTTDGLEGAIAKVLEEK